MSIEKMTFVNIVGNLNVLNNCILKLIKFKMFHIEKIKEKETEKIFKNLDEQNPYAENLNKINKILDTLEIDKSFEDFEDFDMNVKEKEEEFLKCSYDKIVSKEKSINDLENKIKNLEKSLNILGHIKNLDSNLNNLKNTNYVEINFGKISKEGYVKLSDFKDYNYFFIKQDEDEEFYWGFFVTQKKDKEITENIFKSVNFLEYELPNNLKENPENSKKEILSQIEILKEKIYDINTEKEKFKDVNFKNLEITYKKLKILNDVFNYRKFAQSNEKQFNICGFIPTKNINDFKLIFKEEDRIVLEFLKQKESKIYSPPVKLKTCRIFKPFEMYITTYGTPQYESINPSSFVGLIYSLIFGIMFGDLGQGLVLLLGGIIFWKKKKSSLGLILTRCGFSSAIFGAIYNSVFGYEGILKYKVADILPFELLKPSNSIKILVISCLLGMFIILTSITINIILKLKNKKFGEALFSHNGLAGFVCYASCTAAVLCLIFLKRNIFSPVVLALTVILPLILIFFSIPLENIFEKNKKLKTKKEKFTVSAAIFDMIDILLSYFTNTLSFLRIGGLALSHAALMLVVMEFEKMAANVNYVGNITGPLVVVLGNAFVILLEGLIVSIQALRLIYYEMFSRFYQANGKPFTPVKINFKEQ